MLSMLFMNKLRLSKKTVVFSTRTTMTTTTPMWNEEKKNHRNGMWPIQMPAVQPTVYALRDSYRIARRLSICVPVCIWVRLCVAMCRCESINVCCWCFFSSFLHSGVDRCCGVAYHLVLNSTISILTWTHTSLHQLRRHRLTMEHTKWLKTARKCWKLIEKL